MPYKIIGTSHISKKSIQEIKNSVEEWHPNIIGVELDTQRAKSLLSGESRKVGISAITQIGVKGFVFIKIGQFVQQKLGKMVGIVPGADMKSALMIAKEKGMKVALIDQPIQITLARFSRAFTWREKGRFVADIFRGIFSPRKQIKNLGLEEFDLRGVPTPEVIEKMMGQLQQKYPSLYSTLVDERNQYMVKKLIVLLRKFPDQKILVIVGAGHVKGMEELLLKVDILT
jgi:pheromone shutdown-related protein TraB